MRRQTVAVLCRYRLGRTLDLNRQRRLQASGQLDQSNRKPIAGRLGLELDDGLLRVVAFSSSHIIAVALLAEVEEDLLVHCGVPS